MEDRFNKGKDIFSFMMKGRTLRAISTIAALGVATGVLAQGMTFDAVKNDIKSQPTAWKIVVGADAKASDVIGAVEIGSAMTTFNVQTQTIDLTNVRVELEKQTTQVQGEVPLYKDTAKLKLNNRLDDIYTVISDGLVFGDKTYKDNKNVEYTYTLKLYPGTDATSDGPQIKFADRPDTTTSDPSLFVDGGSTPLYTLEVKFYTPLNTSAVKATEIELFGKKFYIDSIDTTNNIWKLREAANRETLNVGETIDFEGHSVKLVDVVEESGGSFAALVEIDGVRKKVAKGESDTISGVDVYVADAYVSKTNPSNAYAELVLGGKLVELQKNSYAKVGGTEDRRIWVADATDRVLKLEVKKSDVASENILLPGQEFVDPLFGTFKLVFSPVDLKAGKDMVSFSGGSTGRVQFTDFAGRQQTLEFFGLDSSNNFVVKTEWKTFDDARVVENAAWSAGTANLYTVYDTSASTLPARRFVVEDSTAQESYVFEVSSVDLANGKVTFREVLSGNDFSVPVGRVSVQTHIDLNESATAATYNDDGTNTTVKIYKGTLEAGSVQVPVFVVDDGSGRRLVFVNSTVAGVEVLAYWDGEAATPTYVYPAAGVTLWGKDAVELEVVGGSTSGTVKVYQPDGTNGPDATADVVVTFAKDGTYNEVDITQVQYDPDSAGASTLTALLAGENNKQYALTEFGTYVDATVLNGQSGTGTVTVYVPKEQVWYDVKLAPTEAETVTETMEVGVGQEIDETGWKVTDISGLSSMTYISAVSMLSGVAVLDTEVTDADTKLIAVGGPAVNRVTAEFLGLQYPTYGDVLQEQGILEPGKAVVQVAEMDGKVAVLVFGWDAMDTRRAARALALYLAEGEGESAFHGATKVEVGGELTAPTPTKVE